MSGQEQSGLVAVHLLGVPVELQARAAEHTQDLQREFVLIADGLQHTEGPSALPRRLLDLIEALQRRYGGFTVEQEDQLDAALQAGVPTLDLTFHVPADVAEAAVGLDALLDEADDYCREGRHLLTLATPPDLVAFRRWYLQQFVDQIEGRPPTRWDGPLA
ncbi:MAG TPA: hypothetical protein VE781_11035 [Kineosporiaceae bacterium]|nr:hypothetical protein [Kineosporiaceae bacterium]